MLRDDTINYAGFWERLLAFVIDLGILSIIFFVIGILIGIIGLVADIAHAIGYISGCFYIPYMSGSDVDILALRMCILIAIIYFPFLESSSKQGTYGKNLLGLKVTNVNGDKLSLLSALLRNIVKVISFITLIGFLMIGFNKEKQGLHDLVLRTSVVKK